jgi:hypothetical protein
LAGARYEIREATPEFPPPQHNASWYVFATRLEELGKTAHATFVWEDNTGNIYIESRYLGDTTNWVENEYGEKAAIEAFEMDYSDFDTARKLLARRFPIVDSYLKDYERIVAEVVSKHGVDMRVRCSPRKGGASLRLCATLNVQGMTTDQKIAKIKLNVGTLKEASDRIDEYEARRARTRQAGHAREP